MKKTLEQLGIHNYFYHQRGINNAITDVFGVLVGHKTIVEGEKVKTGVTVIIPPVDFSKNGLIAGGFVFNANGEMTGLQYILEEAKMISPIFLTNTFSVGDVFSAVVDYYQGKIALPIIGECWDGYLNDIEGRHVKKKHVFQAIKNAKGGQVEQGCVGAGTGMTSFGYKSGIGSASRVVCLGDKKYTVGVLLNNNLGNEDHRHKYLRIGGVDVGKLLGEYTTRNKIREMKQQEGHQSSTIIIIATDVPLDHHQLNRLSKHAVLGMGRIGIVSYSGSGDFIVSFSTANKVPKRETKVHWSIETIEETLLDDLFEAAIESVEEAYINSFLMAETTQGRSGTIKALPITDIISKGNPK